MTRDMSDYIPFQVQLTRAQHRRLKELAADRGASMGSIVRESVADYLTGLPGHEDPALGVVGLVHDTDPEVHGDPAIEHDVYIAIGLEREAEAEAPALGGQPRPRS